MRFSVFCALVGVGASASVVAAHVARQIGPISLPPVTSQTDVSSTDTATPTDTDTTSTPIEISTTTSATPTTSGTPSLAFNHIVTMTACAQGSITWDYSGSDENINIVAESMAPSSTESTSHNTDDTLRRRFPAPTNAPLLPPFRIGLAGAGNAIGRRQDVPGVQQTIASSIDAASQSYSWNPVNMPEGTYILIAQSEDFLVNAQSERFRVENGTDTSCLAGSSASSTASSSASATGSSSAAPSSASRVNGGAIAGGVIGGLIVIAAAVAAFFIFGRRGGRPGGPRRASRNWGALKSVDNMGSSGAAGGYAAGFGSQNRLRHGSAGSGFDIGVGAAGARALPSEEDVASLAEEKMHSPTHGGAMIAPLPFEGSGAYNHKRSSTNSSLHYTTREHPAAEHPFYTQATAPAPATPHTPTQPEMIPMNRSPSSGGGSGSGQPRKAARKAVPKYVPTEVSSASPTPSASSATHAQEGGSGMPELTHKSSFGPGDTRPVHYLIPDMPSGEMGS